MNSIDVNIPLRNKVDVNQYFRTFEFNGIPNLSIKNLNFYYTESGVGGMNFDGLTISNCEFRHVKTAFAVIEAHNSVVDHCFIEDTYRNGCSFAGNNFTIQNCIIRHVGRSPENGFGVDFWSGCNHTYILNNDISDGPSSLVFFGASPENEYDVETYKGVLIENNHIHHGGYGIVDDLASMFFGRHPRGVIVNHNKVHDFYTNNYCGNGIYSDTGTSGVKVMNNLVYNLSHSGYNLNYGKEEEVYNNIMALCRAGFSFGGYRPDSKYTLNIHNNIVYLNRDESFPVEGPVLNDDVTNLFDYNIYYKTNDRAITINGITFDQWKERGHDEHSLIIDPLFNDPENGDFTFKSKENADKIGFKEFNMTFGVIGEEWRKRAEDFTYHDPVVRTHEHPIIGVETFENGDESYFYKRANLNKNPDGLSVGITDEKSFSGSHSFKIQHIAEGTEYHFNFPTFFRNGTAEFTMMLYVNEESSFIFDFGIYGWIFMKNNKLNHIWDGGELLGTYQPNKWFKLGFRANVGDAIVKREKPTCTLFVDDKEKTIEINSDEFKYIDYVHITSNGKGTAYFDDFNSSINQYVEPYFADFLVVHPSKPDDSSSDQNPDLDSSSSLSTDDDKNDNDKNDNNGGGKKGLKSGQIAGIVIGVILFVAICVGVAIFILKRKASKQTSDDKLFGSMI